LNTIIRQARSLFGTLGRALAAGAGRGHGAGPAPVAGQRASLRRLLGLRRSYQRRAEYLETLIAVSQEQGDSPDMTSALFRIVACIQSNLGFQRTMLYLTDDEAIKLALREFGGQAPDWLEARGLQLGLPAGSLVEQAASSGRASQASRLVPDSGEKSGATAPTTELATPLLVRGRALGVLLVARGQPPEFDREEINAIQVIANQAAVAVENARLLRETKTRFDAVVALHETSLDLVSELDKAKLLEALLRRGASLLGVSTAAIFVYDPELQQIHNLANYNTWRDWTGVSLKLGEGVTGKVVESGEPMIVNDYVNWPGKAEIFSRTTNPRVMGAPLAWQGQVIGALIVDKPLEERPFDQQDLWLLGMFADLASIAIVNADLHLQVKQFGHELERKVEERTRELAAAKEEIAAKAEQLRLLLTNTIRIQEQERSRIALDIHDGVLQLAGAIRYEMQAARNMLPGSAAADSTAKLEAARQALDELETELRRVVYDLRPPALDEMGLLTSLQDHVRRFQQLTGIECSLKVAGEPFRLAPDIETDVYRIVLEALQNVASHAKATSVSVSVKFHEKTLSAEVADNGRGFDASQFGGEARVQHLGLLSMRQRAEDNGGCMEVHSDPAEGTRVIFRDIGR
jgi:signal transduction histidine kinase